MIKPRIKKISIWINDSWSYSYWICSSFYAAEIGESPQSAFEQYEKNLLSPQNIHNIKAWVNEQMACFYGRDY